MLAQIKYCLKNLLTFSGRDSRKIFWTYFLFVILLNILIMLAATVPVLSTIFTEASSHASSGSSAAVNAAVMDSMLKLGLPEMLVRIGLSLGLLNIALLSAAFVRRSHDSGLPGMVLLVPLALQMVWMYFSYRQLAGLQSTLRAAVVDTQTGGSPAVHVGMVAQDLIGWLVVLIVVAIGIIKSQPAPNQYGDAPVKL